MIYEHGAMPYIEVCVARDKINCSEC